MTPSGPLYLTSTLPPWRGGPGRHPSGWFTSSRGAEPAVGKARGDLVQALHLKADVVDAAEVLAALGAGHGVVLEVQDGQIEVAVAQVVAAGAG